MYFCEDCDLTVLIKTQKYDIFFKTAINHDRGFQKYGIFIKTAIWSQSLVIRYQHSVFSKQSTFFLEAITMGHLSLVAEEHFYAWTMGAFSWFKSGGSWSESNCEAEFFPNYDSTWGDVTKFTHTHILFSNLQWHDMESSPLKN